MAGGEAEGVITYSHITEMADFEQVLLLQRLVWGFDDVEAIPSRLFSIAVKVGGQVIGAFDGGRLVGYCFSIPGIKKDRGQPYLHSHMLAVLPEYRNRGIGRQLKLEQRIEALSRNINLVEWTFDPLELKNAYLNIERLGVVVRRYVPNAYGVTTSKLHGGLPTDRCVAEWNLDDPRTAAILEGAAREDAPVEARISITMEIDRLRRDNPKQAALIQRDASAKFQKYFDRSLVVTGFERSDTLGTYLLGTWR